MITLDTSGILAALNRADPDHRWAREALTAERGPLIVPVGILADVGYMIEVDLGATVLRQFVGDVGNGYFKLDWGASDMERLGRCWTATPCGWASRTRASSHARNATAETCSPRPARFRAPRPPGHDHRRSLTPR